MRLFFLLSLTLVASFVFAQSKFQRKTEFRKRPGIHLTDTSQPLVRIADEQSRGRHLLKNDLDLVGSVPAGTLYQSRRYKMPVVVTAPTGDRMNAMQYNMPNGTAVTWRPDSSVTQRRRY